MTLTGLYRFPVKGFSGESQNSVQLVARSHFPFDRLYAIESGPTGFDAQKPMRAPKQNYLGLMTLPKLAALKTTFEAATHRFTLRQDGVVVAEGHLETAQGRAAIEDYLADFLKDHSVGRLKVLKGPEGFRFTDSRRGFVSILNLNTLRAIEAEAGDSLDPVRFRANIVLDGLPPFAEHDLIGRDVRIGDVVLQGLKRIKRCAATTVNPNTARRDVMVPALLQRKWGHADCGLYFAVKAGGSITVGDDIEVLA